MNYVVTAFKLGTSTVVTLPKALKISPGTSFHLLPKKSGIHLKVKPEKLGKESPGSLIRKLAGGFSGGGKDYSPKELDDLYDKETYEF